MAGVGKFERMCLDIIGSVKHRDKHGRVVILTKKRVGTRKAQRRRHTRGGPCLDQRTAHCHEHRGRHAFS